MPQSDPPMKRVEVHLVIPESLEQATVRAIYAALDEIAEHPECGFNYWNIETEKDTYDFDDDLPEGPL